MLSTNDRLDTHVISLYDAQVSKGKFPGQLLAHLQISSFPNPLTIPPG